MQSHYTCVVLQHVAEEWSACREAVPRHTLGFLIKGLAIRTGQTDVQKFLPQLPKHIENGDLQTEDVISNRMPLDQVAEGYKIFEVREQDCRKVVITSPAA